MKSCSRIAKMTNLEKLRTMRKKYLEIKERRKGMVSIAEIAQMIQTLPVKCPEILVPHLEALL